MKRVGFFLTLVIGALIGSLLTLSVLPSAAMEKAEGLGFPVFVNAQEVHLEHYIVKEGRTFFQLRELCRSMGVAVRWMDDQYHMPVPGGNLKPGIHLDVPSYLYVYDGIKDHLDTDRFVKAVDITGVYLTYQHWWNEERTWDYYFDSWDFVVKYGEGERRYPIHVIADRDRYYLEVEEFRRVVLPYFLDLCMQAPIRDYSK